MQYMIHQENTLKQAKDDFMKLIKLKSTLLIAVALFISTSGIAKEDHAFKKQIKGRQAVMQVYSYNLGLLGGMAKGKSPYDAKIASAAANNLLATASMDNSTMWPAGSGADADGLKGKTRAKPEIWSTYPKVGEKGKNLKDALVKMAAEAGNGLDAVKANMGAVGKGCKGCHEDFRTEKKKK